MQVCDMRLDFFFYSVRFIVLQVHIVTTKKTINICRGTLVV